MKPKEFVSLFRQGIWLLLVLFTTPLFSQKTITGTVTDANSGEVLIGANVVVVGTTTGSVTDLDGKYSVDVPEGATVLEFSYTGYQSLRQTIAGSVLDVKLTEGTTLDEVVVIGYGVQRKKDVAGAISKIKTDQLTDIPAPSFDAALQGKALGVQVMTGSGLAGAGSMVRIRGIGSVSAGGEPLYVIDGVPMTNDPFLVGGQGDRSAQQFNPLAAINPNDIESIEVLKDAGSAGIYGSRGANGVILVTTKKGAGKSALKLSTRLGIVQPTLKPDFLDRDEWLQVRQQAWENDGGTGYAWLPNFSSASQTDAQRAAAWNKALANNTDWWDLLTRTGFSQEYNLSYNWGTKNVKTFASLTFKDQDSYLKKNNYSQLAGRLNLDWRVTDKLDINFGGNISGSKDIRVNNAWEGGLGGAMSTALPIYPTANADGTYFLYNSSANGGNPLRDLNEKDWQVRETRYLANVGINYKLTDKLTLNGKVGGDFLKLHEYKFFSKAYDTRALPLDSKSASAEDDFADIKNLTGNLSLTYLKDFENNSSLNVLGGTEYQKLDAGGTFSSVSGSKVTVPFYDGDYQLDLTPEAGVYSPFTSTDEGSNYSFASFFARAIYNLKGKYIFNVLARADGSSKFGRNNRWGFFPSVSVAWLASDEEFLKNQDLISYLKVRTSFGITGNAAGLPDYQWLKRYQVGSQRSDNYLGVTPIGVTATGNPDLKWETVNNFDAGFDMNLFKDRIMTEFGFYYKKTKDALVNINNRPTSGATSVFKNALEVDNYGAEFSITTVNIKRKNFEWKTNFNIANNRNEVKSLNGLAPDAFQGGTNDTRVIEGYPLGTNFLVRYYGVDPEDGLPIWLDKDGYQTKVHDLNNRVPAGSVIPDAIGGFGSNLSIKGFNFDVQFAYSIGGNIYDNSGKRQLGVITDWNVRRELLDFWSANNTDSYFPRLTMSESNGYPGLTNAWQYNSTMFLYDASYMRLRNVTLGYTFPIDKLTNMKMQALNISFTGSNLLTFTKFTLDPEIVRDFENPADRNLSPNVTYLVAPQARTFTVSLNATF